MHPESKNKLDEQNGQGTHVDSLSKKCHVDDCLVDKTHVDKIELSAKLLDYFFRSNKSNIYQCGWSNGFIKGSVYYKIIQSHDVGLYSRRHLILEEAHIQNGRFWRANQHNKCDYNATSLY